MYPIKESLNAVHVAYTWARQVANLIPCRGRSPGLSEMVFPVDPDPPLGGPDPPLGGHVSTRLQIVLRYAGPTLRGSGPGGGGGGLIRDWSLITGRGGGGYKLGKSRV